MPESPLTDAELIALRKLLAMSAPDPVKDAARKAAQDAVTKRQEKLRTDAAKAAYGSAAYKDLVSVGDAEVSALIEAARRI